MGHMVRANGAVASPDAMSTSAGLQTSLFTLPLAFGSQQRLRGFGYVWVDCCTGKCMTSHLQLHSSEYIDITHGELHCNGTSTTHSLECEAYLPGCLVLRCLQHVYPCQREPPEKMEPFLEHRPRCLIKLAIAWTTLLALCPKPKSR